MFVQTLTFLLFNPIAQQR